MLFSLGLLLPLIPSFIRSYLATGSPFFSYNDFVLMSYSGKYPEMSVWRDINAPSFFEFIKIYPGQLLSKYAAQFTSLLDNLLKVSNPYLLAFFFADMFYWKVNPDWKRIKVLFLLLLFSQILFVPLNVFEGRYFIPFLPLMSIFASQGLLRMSGALISEVKSRWRKSLAGFLIVSFFLFFATPAVYLILSPGGSPMLNYKTLQFDFLISADEASRINDFLDSELGKDKIVWTDLPEILEWEGNRLCGWLPSQIKDIYEIHKKIPVDAILLTNSETTRRMGEEWNYLLFTQNSLPQYRTVKIYRSRIIAAKLFIRDEQD